MLPHTEPALSGMGLQSLPRTQREAERPIRAVLWQTQRLTSPMRVPDCKLSSEYKVRGPSHQPSGTSKKTDSQRMMGQCVSRVVLFLIPIRGVSGAFILRQ